MSVAVNDIKEVARKRENVTRINAVFIDSDDGNVSKDELLALSCPPHVIVRTSPKRLHAYWFVKNCEVANFTCVQHALAKKFQTDASVSDPTRVMRLPGSINWNHDEPYLAKLAHMSDGKAVSLSRLVKALELNLDFVRPDNAREDGNQDVLNPTSEGTSPAQLPAKSVVQIKGALQRINADDRNLWLRAGMAIHSAAPTQQGFQLWSEWSKKSEKFNAVEQENTWKGFRVGGGINIQSLFWMAKTVGTSTRMDAMQLSDLFVETYRNKLRFDAAMGWWYLFNGVTWQVDKQAPLRLAKALVRDLSNASTGADGSMNAFRNPAGLGQIERMAALEADRMGITETQFDPRPELFATSNGVLNLVTGEFRLAKARDLLRRQANVVFDADASCPLWLKFLHEVTKGNDDLTRFLQRAVGYTIFGHTKSQTFFVIEGSGGNGKGVFLRTITKLLGQYATELAPNLMTTAYCGNANSATPALVVLHGIRLGIVTELPNQRGFDTAFVKQFSGGDSITARGIYDGTITFKPQGKLWISTNDMPEIAAHDKAMWRRIVPIPFLANFSGKRRDDHLEDRLVTEFPGILNWALAGAADYAETGGLGSCSAVDVLKKRLRREADVIGGWLNDNCGKDEDSMLQSSVAYKSYAQYAKSLGKAPIGLPAFGSRLVREGYARKSFSKFNGFVGLTLNDVNR